MSIRLVNSVRRLSPTCQEAARLISDARERQLPAIDRIGLRLHLAICGACRRYKRGLEYLSRLLQSKAALDTVSDEARLSDAAKARMQEKISEQVKR